MLSPITLWLVEDLPQYSRPFAQLLDASREFHLARVFDRFEAAGLALADGPAPDLVVMDLKLPGVGGIEAIARLRERAPSLPVVAMTLSDDPADVYAAVRAGARGYVVKGARREQIFAALREAYDGGAYFSPSVARYVLERFAPPESAQPLTEREHDVLEGLAAGLSKAEIAERLFLSPHTVDTHVRKVYGKLEARTAAQAAAEGVRRGHIS